MTVKEFNQKLLECGFGSDKELAEAAGVSGSTISRFRNGKCNTSGYIRLKLAGVLGVPPKEMYIAEYSSVEISQKANTLIDVRIGDAFVHVGLLYRCIGFCREHDELLAYSFDLNDGVKFDITVDHSTIALCDIQVNAYPVGTMKHADEPTLVDKWIKVEDELPPLNDGTVRLRTDVEVMDSGLLIVHNKYGHVLVGKYCVDHGKYWWETNHGDVIEVTHWQQFPEPPKGV